MKGIFRPVLVKGWIGMYQKGDCIIYGNTGVCRVTDVGVPQGLPEAGGERLYYTLSPVYGNGTIYIPVDSPVFMRPVISREEALDLIDRIPAIKEDTFESRDQRTMAEHYSASLKTHACEDLVQLIKTLYMRSKTLADKGKKPGKTDIQYRKRAEELLHEELAVALGIPVEQVKDYIARSVEEREYA